MHSFPFIEPFLEIAFVGHLGEQAAHDSSPQDLMFVSQLITWNWLAKANAAPVGHRYLQNPRYIKNTNVNKTSDHSIRIVEVLNLSSITVLKGSNSNNILVPVAYIAPIIIEINIIYFK